ncbi:MAG: polyribonucleotide nucleotidyltransferase [Armatimonadota bacterium]
MKQEVSMELAGRPLKLETGRLAQQADASVVVTYGDTVILATACVEDEKSDLPFLPLRVDFEEKMYAVGRVPGGFFKREGKPSEEATRTCRKIDRPIRPLLDSGMRNEMQVLILPLSVEADSSVDVASMIGASAAMHLSSIPFAGPFGAVRVGLIDGELQLNPDYEDVHECDMDLLVAATEEGVVQIELSGDDADDEIVYKGIEMATEACQPIIEMINELREKAGKPKGEFDLWRPREEVVEYVNANMTEQIHDALAQPDKEAVNSALEALRQEAREVLTEEGIEEPGPDVHEVFEDVIKERLQDLAFDEGRRIDGRELDEVRDVSCEVGLLPRAHGSGLFNRGETQVLTVATLGAYKDQKLVRTLEEEEYSRFMHHYNFPPFSTGEVKPMRSASRREIGHGGIGLTAIERILPPEEEFPYTIRLVSEVLAANASTSMAAVCGCSLALMDAGVPIKKPVAGVAMGLIKRGDDYRILSDMQGLEDFMGYMDFKIGGTRDGINVIQLDTKTHGLPLEVLKDGLARGRAGRMEILDVMESVISEPRPTLSDYAPRMIPVQIPQEKIGLVIGPGGKTIRKMQEDYDCTIDVDDEGLALVFGEDPEKVEAAAQQIRDMTREIEPGEVFTGKVVNTTDFGAFVEVMPGRDGLVHISDIDWSHVNKTTDVLNVGDEVTVKCTNVDDEGKIRLSRKAMLDRDGSKKSEGGKKSSNPSRSQSQKGGSKSSKKSEKKSGRPRGKSGGDGEGAPRGNAYFRQKKSE